MFQAKTRSRPSLKDRPPAARAATGLLLLAALFLAACPPPPAFISDRGMRPGSRWDNTDLDYAERVGQEALDKIGYEKIIAVALKNGWIEHRLPRSGNSIDQTVGFWSVFTRYAVTAGVTSQADSPAPGPADVIAIGILVLGLIDAGLLKGHILHSITGNTAPITGPTAAPPVPVVSPTSTPAPTSTTAPPPIPMTTVMATAAPSTTAPPIATTLSPADPKKEKDKRCAEERRVAKDKCIELLFESRNPPRGLTGGHKDLEKCMQGFISQDCGGNKVDEGPRGRPGRR